MDCHRELGCAEGEVRTVLSRHLDGETSGAEADAVEEHLKECARCRDELASLRGADRTVAHSVGLTRASRGFVGRVMSAISGRHRGLAIGGRPVPRPVLWGIAAAVATGAAALVWVVVARLVAKPPEPLRELGLVVPGSVPGLETPGPRWRMRAPGERSWTPLGAGGRLAAGTSVEIEPRGGPGLVERADGLRVYCGPGSGFVLSPNATDSDGLALVEGEVLVVRPAGAGGLAVSLAVPHAEDRVVPATVVTFEGAPSRVLLRVTSGKAEVICLSGEASLVSGLSDRALFPRQGAVVSAPGDIGPAAVVDPRGLEIGFAPPALRPSPWPQVGGSTARDGATPFEFSLPSREIAKVDAALAGASPVIGADGMVYISAGPAPGRLLGLRRGEVAASVGLEEPCVGAPAVAPDGTILVATRGGVLRAPSDLARVEVVLLFGPGDIPRSGPTVSPDGDLYIVLGRGVAAFAPDGRQLWRRDDIRSASPPSVGPDGTVYVAAISGKLHALAPATGEGLPGTSTPVDEPFLSSVAVARDGTAYAVSASRYLVWRAPGGKTGRAALPVSEYVLAPAITFTGEVLVASAAGAIYRLPPRPTEAPGRSFFEAGERITQGPLVDVKGRIVVCTSSGKLVVLEPSGRPTSWELGAEGVSAAAVARDGAILFVSRDGRIFGR